jgi:hypothetical protein
MGKQQEGSPVVVRQGCPSVCTRIVVLQGVPHGGSPRVVTLLGPTGGFPNLCPPRAVRFVGSHMAVNTWWVPMRGLTEVICQGGSEGGTQGGSPMGLPPRGVSQVYSNRGAPGVLSNVVSSRGSPRCVPEVGFPQRWSSSVGSPRGVP